MDSTSRVRDKEVNHLKKLKRTLYEQQLIDPWRIQHPSTKDYTFYSTVHKIYSRLDYIMVEHRNLEEIEETKIGIITASDHSPVILRMKIKGEVLERGPWRINETLLEDSETEKSIIEEIKRYFEENDTPEVSKATIWEAHKSVIRGKLIAIGARKKQERKTNMQQIIKEIYELERKHKNQVNNKIFGLLSQKREQLKDWMEQEERKDYSIVQGKNINWVINQENT